MSQSELSYPASPRLAQAFLALAGDGDVLERRPALTSVVAALAAAFVLALSAPLAWTAASVPPKPSDQPAATAASKAAVPAPDDDGGDGGV